MAIQQTEKQRLADLPAETAREILLRLVDGNSGLGDAVALLMAERVHPLKVRASPSPADRVSTPRTPV